MTESWGRTGSKGLLLSGGTFARVREAEAGWAAMARQRAERRERNPNGRSLNPSAESGQPRPERRMPRSEPRRTQEVRPRSLLVRSFFPEMDEVFDRGRTYYQSHREGWRWSETYRGMAGFQEIFSPEMSEAIAAVRSHAIETGGWREDELDDGEMASLTAQLRDEAKKIWLDLRGREKSETGLSVTGPFGHQGNAFVGYFSLLLDLETASGQRREELLRMPEGLESEQGEEIWNIFAKRMRAGIPTLGDGPQLRGQISNVRDLLPRMGVVGEVMLRRAQVRTRSERSLVKGFGEDMSGDLGFLRLYGFAGDMRERREALLKFLPKKALLEVGITSLVNLLRFDRESLMERVEVLQSFFGERGAQRCVIDDPGILEHNTKALSSLLGEARKVQDEWSLGYRSGAQRAYKEAIEEVRSSGLKTLLRKALRHLKCEEIWDC